MFQPLGSGTDRDRIFSMAYLNESQLSPLLADDRVMAIIRFGSPIPLNLQDPRQLTVALSEVGNGNTVEVWYSRPPLQHCIGEGGIRAVQSAEVLFAHLWVEEADYPDLNIATYAAYGRMLAFIRQQGYPYLLRVWNYFPGINQEDGGLERYKAFCLGRHKALLEESADFETRLPAACAIGTQKPGLLIYCLAAKQPGIQVESPRQISAFRYPSQYGPRSPSFSRAVLKTWGAAQRHLYISGTASIVGHATRHAWNLSAQFQETLHNLQALLSQANGRVRSPFQLALLKVYIRPPVVIERLRDSIEELFGPAIPILLLQADICRSDLLVEIEGMGISIDAC